VIFYIADFGWLPQKRADLVNLYWRMAARMGEMPDVNEASIVTIPPLYGWVYRDTYTAVGYRQQAQTALADRNEIGAHYFLAVGKRLLEGRDLRNANADLNSCIVNESAALLYFPHASALGRTLRRVRHNMSAGTTAVRDCQIVGEVESTKYDSLHEIPPAIVYRPLVQDSDHLPGLFFVLHARSLAEAGAAYRTVLREMASASPETDPGTFQQLFDDSSAREQLLSVLSGFFAALGVLLSGIGIYGLLAWNVTQQTPEIGVRMALGASRLHVFLLVLRQTAVLLAAGILFGGVGAFFAARAVRSFLYEVQGENPGVFAAAALILVAVAVVAASMRARRAVSIDPMEALRTE
jgi:hypothetical protein